MSNNVFGFWVVGSIPTGQGAVGQCRDCQIADWLLGSRLAGAAVPCHYPKAKYMDGLNG